MEVAAFGSEHCPGTFAISRADLTRASTFAVQAIPTPAPTIIPPACRIFRGEAAAQIAEPLAFSAFEQTTPDAALSNPFYQLSHGLYYRLRTCSVPSACPLLTDTAWRRHPHIRRPLPHNIAAHTKPHNTSRPITSTAPGPRRFLRAQEARARANKSGSPRRTGGDGKGPVEQEP